ncbi:MAG TPA: Nif3-like dinuclear metal center hexameric protein [Gemmatimonadaceae bacterium]|nr:Nif3-like dinuclear metal center hexameric protein [Gemmatimonadaceae bacterium]
MVSKPMRTAREIARYADSLLDSVNTPDYPNAVNGLQLENRGIIEGIAAAVDYSTRAIEGAITAKANLLVVHHGMFWGGLGSLVGPAYSRLRLMLDHDVAVYSSHLPLDRHTALGNNALLAKELELQPQQPFARHEHISIGVAGTCDIETEVLLQRAHAFAAREGGTARVSHITAGRRTKTWAICTGAGASADTLAEAISDGIDTLIVGEGPHWTAVSAEDHGIAIIYAGHYATETLGVRALAMHLGEKFAIPWTFIPAPTGL